MEESSEKRRERLQAMRMEASHQSQPISSSSPPSNQSLSNPLMNLSAAGERTPPAPRFDFYTDPMAAFSSSKRRHPLSSPTETFSPPVRSPSPLSCPSNRPIGGPGNYHVPGHQHQHGGFQFQTSQSPNQTPWRSPNQFQRPFSGHTGGTPPSYTPNPNSWNQSSGGSPGHGFRPNFSSRGRGIPSPSFGHGGSSSPHSNPGRGSGGQFRGSGSGPRPGRSGGRGRHSNCSSPHDPYHFYKAVMKDPWRKLKPIVGSILGSGSASWLPKSIAAPKRAKVSDSGSKSRLSLAESLALSLDEAAGDV